MRRKEVIFTPKQLTPHPFGQLGLYFYNVSKIGVFVANRTRLTIKLRLNLLASGWQYANNRRTQNLYPFRDKGFNNI
jgi:hypothetical protein